MARARLHVICGNCGCNDKFTYEYDKWAFTDAEGIWKDDVYLTCNNCSTIHCLSDNAEWKGYGWKDLKWNNKQEDS